MAIISNGIVGVLGGTREGPQIGTAGTREVTYWDPSPPFTANTDGSSNGGDGSGGGNFNGDPILYGTGPLFSENPWDLVILAGEKLPGICTIKCEPTLQIDQQKGPKHDGAILTLHGVLPSPIDITVKIWTQLQWAQLVIVIPKIWRKPLKALTRQDAASKYGVSPREARLIQSASSIYHPGLVPFGITQVVVKGVSLPEDGPEPQSKIVRIKCIEFQQPTKQTVPNKIRKAKAAVDPEVVRPLDPPSKTHSGPTD